MQVNFFQTCLLHVFCQFGPSDYKYDIYVMILKSQYEFQRVRKSPSAPNKPPAHQQKKDGQLYSQRTNPFRAHQQCFSAPTHFPRTNAFYAHHTLNSLPSLSLHLDQVCFMGVQLVIVEIKIYIECFLVHLSGASSINNQSA